MTYYELLEVSESASLEVITMAYRTLAVKYHPDKYKGDPEFAKTHWKRINAAYLVLSVPEERQQYDEFLRLKRSPGQDIPSKTPKEPDAIPKKPKKQKKEKMPPTFKRSAITVGIMFLLAFAMEVLRYVIVRYIYGDASLGYAFYFAFVDFALFSFLYLFLPLLIGAIKKDCSLKFIESMAWINSAAVMLLLNVITESSVGEGWGLALVYAIINKHVVFQMHQKIMQKKHRIISASIALFVFLFSLVGGMVGGIVIADAFEDVEYLENHKKLNSSRYEGTDYYVDEYGNVYKKIK